MVFEGFGREGTEERDGPRDGEVGGEACAEGGGAEFVGDGGAPVDVGCERGGEGPAETEFEGEEVTPGFECMRVLAGAVGAFEEGPFVAADDVLCWCRVEYGPSGDKRVRKF